MSQKCSDKFYCELCDYKCTKQSVFNKHLTTRKHINNNDNNAKMFQKCPTIYECEFCPKVFKDRAGLWRHNKKCNEDTQKPLEPPERNTDSAMIIELLKQNQEFKQLMIDQSNQIQQQQAENQELQKQLIEAVKVGGSHIENQTNIHNNQKFNLQFFLNEQCKDAINMSDFIENMELDLEDLTETGRLGYVGGISRILINKLQELDIYKRPLHCTDMKRETLYIKDNDEWEKQANSKEKMSKIIGQVANKNCRNIPKWTEEHPEYQVFDSPENMEYMNMTQAVLGGFGEEENKQFKDKIIRGVIKEVLVNK